MINLVCGLAAYIARRRNELEEGTYNERSHENRRDDWEYIPVEIKAIQIFLQLFVHC